MDGDAINGVPEREPVASFRHSLVFVAIVAIVVAAGYAAQHRQVAGGGLAESHAHVIPIYVSAAVLDWLLLWFAWSGIRRRGGTFGSVIRGRWASGLDVARDVGIAALAWGVMSLAGMGMERLLGHGQEKSLDILLPRTLLEVLVWIATSASAGFCEEFVFRGYVQRQLFAFSGSAAVARARPGGRIRRDARVPGVAARRPDRGPRPPLRSPGGMAEDPEGRDGGPCVDRRVVGLARRCPLPVGSEARPCESPLS